MLLLPPSYFHPLRPCSALECYEVKVAEPMSYRRMIAIGLVIKGSYVAGRRGPSVQLYSLMIQGEHHYETILHHNSTAAFGVFRPADFKQFLHHVNQVNSASETFQPASSFTQGHVCYTHHNTVEHMFAPQELPCCMIASHLCTCRNTPMLQPACYVQMLCMAKTLKTLK